MSASGKRHYSRNPAHVIRDAEMVLMFRDGKTLQEIGDKYCITRERVRQRLSALGLSRLDGGACFRSFTRIDEVAAKTKRAAEHGERCHFIRWGMSRADMDAISSALGVSRSSGGHPIRKYTEQRRNARTRAIEWQMTFAEWWKVWQESGHWDKRGRGKGYCMARWADDGPYSVENVYICTIGQNFSDSYITKPWAQRFPNVTLRNPPGTSAAYKNRPTKTHWKFGKSWVVQMPDGTRRFGLDHQAAALLAESLKRSQAHAETPAASAPSAP